MSEHLSREIVLKRKLDPYPTFIHFLSIAMGLDLYTLWRTNKIKQQKKVREQRYLDPKSCIRHYLMTWNWRASLFGAPFEFVCLSVKHAIHSSKQGIFGLAQECFKKYCIVVATDTFPSYFTKMNFFYCQPTNQCKIYTIVSPMIPRFFLHSLRL